MSAISLSVDAPNISVIKNSPCDISDMFESGMD